MQHIEQKRTLPFRPEQLYKLVGDIERYPEFLPWCQEVKILRRKPTQHSADARVVVGFMGIRYSYHCRVLWCREEQRISVEYLSGPLADMYTEWKFCPLPDRPQHCEIHFIMRLAFRRRLLGATFEGLQLKAIETMTDAFIQRAEGLYNRA